MITYNNQYLILPDGTRIAIDHVISWGPGEDEGLHIDTVVNSEGLSYPATEVRLAEMDRAMIEARQVADSVQITLEYKLDDSTGTPFFRLHRTVKRIAEG
jgi:hypothetical protein